MQSLHIVGCVSWEFEENCARLSKFFHWLIFEMGIQAIENKNNSVVLGAEEASSRYEVLRPFEKDVAVHTWNWSSKKTLLIVM